MELCIVHVLFFCSRQNSVACAEYISFDKFFNEEKNPSEAHQVQIVHMQISAPRHQFNEKLTK